MTALSPELLQQALDMNRKALDFCDAAIAGCPECLGKDVFEVVRSNLARHNERIRSIHASIGKGANWSQAATTLPNSMGTLETIFKNLATKYPADSAGATKREALSSAVEMITGILTFYEKMLCDVQDPAEEQFIKRMVQEIRGQYVLLNDLSYYYDNPKGWSEKHLA